ncbi:MAG: 50S ribosomal protein L17 [Bacteroidales bacterium]|nr:50S ribosomal protein L17 [Bacteroidales bacterium]
MRHGKKFNHLGRTSSHRKAMLANMAVSLIKHKRITTTLAKAKALRVYIEPLITKSKEDSTHSRRVVFSYLKDKEAVTELFRNISVKVADRPGGYTRILKTGNRLGDNAEMCIIELVDYNENLLEGKKEKIVKKTRRRGSGKKKVTQEVSDNNNLEKEAVVEKTDEPNAEVSEQKIQEDSKQETKTEE